jgi:hypothetical protein
LGKFSPDINLLACVDYLTNNAFAVIADGWDLALDVYKNKTLAQQPDIQGRRAKHNQTGSGINMEKLRLPG